MDTKKYLTDSIEKLKKEIQGLEAALFAYTASINNSTDVINEEPIKTYKSSINNPIPKDITWIDQIIFVLKDRNRFLHNSEIAEALLPYYPKKDLFQVKRRVSAVMSNALRNNEIEGLVNYRFTNSKKDTVWGKKDWIDNNGRLKKEHMYISNKKTARTVEL
jgi:hypothetical protein